MNLYSGPFKSRLRKFISSCGGIEEAANRLDVYSAALIQVLHDDPVPEYARRNIENILGPLVQSQQTLSPGFAHRPGRQEKRIATLPNHSRLDESLTERVKKLLTNERNPQVLYWNDTNHQETIGQVSSAQSDLRSRLQRLMQNNSEVAVLETASRLGVNAASVRKILEGEPISRGLEIKLRIALERVGTAESGARLRPSITDRLTEAFRLYDELGTLEEVGKRMGITRERVRQLLVKGTRLGLFDYKRCRYPYIPKDKLIADLIKYRALGEVAQANQISPSYLGKLLTTYSISKDVLQTYREEGQRSRCIEDYYKLKEKLGHDPTTTELQRTASGHALHARICRLWRSIDAFRKELDIPTPVRAYPHWLEPRRRIAFIARMQHLDTLRDCLSSARPKSVSEIVFDCSFTANRVRRLLKLLIASQEAEQLGTGSDTKYRLYLH